MSNEGGAGKGNRALSPYGVVTQLGHVIGLVLNVRDWDGLADGGVVFTVGPRRARLTVTVHVTDEDLYDVVLYRAGRPLTGWADASPESVGAIVRQLVNSTFPEGK